MSRPALARWIRAKHWNPQEDPGRVEVRAGKLGKGRILGVRHERGNAAHKGREAWLAAIEDLDGVEIVWEFR